MSAFLPSDFTKQSENTKARLDEVFRIIAQEEAFRITEAMRQTLETEKSWENLSDLQDELLDILETIPRYVRDHHIENADGIRYAKSLISNFSPSRRDEIEEAIDTYEYYAGMLKSIDEINKTVDAVFLNELNKIYSEYKSSTDHMTRLVRRLMKYNLGYSGEFTQADTTRLLILKQFIREFGYDCTGIRCKALKKAVEEKYDGDFEKLDDSIFDLISQRESTEEADTADVLFSDDYIDSLTKFQDTVKIKAPLVYVTKDICSQICSVVSADAVSDAAVKGTAVLLSDCFKKPYFEFEMKDIKNYSEIDNTEKIDQLNEALRKRYSRGYLLYTDFSYSLRLYTLLKIFGNDILISRRKETEKQLVKLYPEAFTDALRETDKKDALSKVFDLQKIKYQAIDEAAYCKLVKKLESALLDPFTGKEKKAMAKEYSAALGKVYEKVTRKKLGEPITYLNYSQIFRLMVLVEKYAKYIPVTEEAVGFLRSIVPDVDLPEKVTAKCFSELFENNLLTAIKGISELKNEARNDAVNNFVSYAEAYIEDKNEYTAALRKRVESRYNNSSKRGSGTDFLINRTALYSSKAKKARKYILLEIADALANAAFSSQGKTREYLYIFAIAFDLRPVAKGHPQRVCDLEKNLFQDYYNDNIINNMPLVAGLGDKSDMMVDGYAINYKNFSEVIFLWCLAQGDMSAKERLKTAYEIIEHCKEKGMSEENFRKSAGNSENSECLMTAYYKSKTDYIKSLSKEELKDYITKNYPCKSDNSGMMQINYEQRTATRVIAEQEAVVNDLLKKAEAVIPFQGIDSKSLKKAMEDDDFMTFFYEHSYLTNYKCRSCPKKSASMFPDCRKYFEPFTVKVYTEMKQREITFEDCGKCVAHYIKKDNAKKNLENRFLKLKGKSFKSAEEYFENSFSRVNELCDESQQPLKALLDRIKKRLLIKSDNGIHFKTVSRSTVMAVCFYQFVLINCLKRQACITTMFGNFEKFYDVFCNGDVFTVDLDYIGDADYTDDDYLYDDSVETICYPGANKILEQAGYAPVNCKNIFDIYLIFIAYRDNFLPLYTDPVSGVIEYYKDLYDRFMKIKTEREMEEK